jgi:hypothetical protein
MTRAFTVAVLVAFALAAPASAAPIPIRHDRGATAIALAGPEVIVASQGRQGALSVVALPRTGGKARTLLSVPHAVLADDEGILAASAQRVAVMIDVEGHPDEHRVYSGPPSGPLKLVRRTPDPNGDAWTPVAVSVDGDRLLLVEALPVSSSDDEEQTDAGPVRAQILDASGWTPVPWTSSTHVPVAIAGPYAAAIAYAPMRIEVADFATGAPLATVTGEWPERLSLDLAADGRIAVQVPRAIKTAGPGQPQQTVPGSTELTSPRFAGPSLAVFDDARDTLDLIGAGGKTRTLGPRSMVRTDVDADDQGVAWVFNGCVRYEPFGTAAHATHKNPCPTSEVALWTIGPSSKLHGNTATAQVKCVTSAGGRCRGRLVARSDIGKPIIGRGTFDIPVGDRWHKVPVHFDRRTVAKFRRERRGSVVVNAIVRNGTVGTGADYSSEFGVEVG